MIALGYRPAQLRQVFRPRRDFGHPDRTAPIQALVLWYSEIPARPEAKTGMYQVCKEVDSSGNPRVGVVDLSRIVALCPLMPVVEGNCPSVWSGMSLDHFNKFFINHYSSHSNYRRLQVQL